MSTDSSAFQTAHRPRFVMVPLHIFDGDLSAKAIGILAYCLSRPPEWTYYQREIRKHFTDGREAISTGIPE